MYWKLIAIVLVVFFPFYIISKAFTVMIEAIEDSRLYALSMFIESFKFHWNEHDLTLTEYLQLVKESWNTK